MIIVVVRKAGWQKSPWDSYTKMFESEEAYLDWWNGLPDDSYTKKVSREYDRVRVFRGDEVADELLMPMVIPPRDHEKI